MKLGRANHNQTTQRIISYCVQSGLESSQSVRPLLPIIFIMKTGSLHNSVTTSTGYENVLRVCDWPQWEGNERSQGRWDSRQSRFGFTFIIFATTLGLRAYRYSLVWLRMESIVVIIMVTLMIECASKIIGTLLYREGGLMGNGSIANNSKKYVVHKLRVHLIKEWIP